MSLSILSYSLITYSFTTLMIHTFIFYFRTHLFNLIFKPNILFYWNLNSLTCTFALFSEFLLKICFRFFL